MGRLPRHDDRLDGRIGQAAKGQTGRGRRNLEAVDGKVPASGDGEGGQCCLRDRTSGRWSGGGIEVGIHARRLLWHQNSQEEDWGFLLIDARNAFNEENWTEIIWAVQHKWTSGAQFPFNCYRHWSTLVVRDTEYGSGHLLHSKEGLTQGHPLSMIAYSIGVLPLIRELLEAHPCVTQPWYTDDAGRTGGGIK